MEKDCLRMVLFLLRENAMYYQKFRDEIVKKIRGYLPEEYAGWEMKVEFIRTRRGRREAVLIGSGEDGTAVPTLYIDMLYEWYQSCGSLEKTLRFAAEFYVSGMRYGRAMSECMRPEPREDGIIMALINTERNRELLSDVPNRSCHDMSIIYRYMIPLPDRSFNAVTITNALAEREGLSEERLYELAMENTPRMLPLYTENIGENINVLSNDRGIIGAAAMLYRESLANISEMMESDLYVIPSSVHEIITLPVEDASADKLRKMIYEANRTVLEAGDMLSDTLYYYSRENKTMRPAL